MRFSSALLDILACIYGTAVKVRNSLYDHGLLKPKRVPPVVVSVGNIEAGGTGKTPFTMALAGELVKRGLNAAIVTRGYKGTLQGPVIVEPSHSSREVGDEAMLMARLTRIPVIKSPDRVRGALFARALLGSEIVVLDDAFQHRRIHRDMDIVLVSRDISCEKLLPAGHLREHAASLSRAHIIVSLKGARLDGPKASLEPSALVDTAGDTHDLGLIAGRRVLAFCAIGRPDHFFSMLEGLGADLDRLAYEDHHDYTMKDAQEIMDRAAGRDILLTTEKDMVKIDPEWFKGVSDRLYALRVGMHIEQLSRIADEIERLAENSRLPGQG